MIKEIQSRAQISFVYVKVTVYRGWCFQVVGILFSNQCLYRIFFVGEMNFFFTSSLHDFFSHLTLHDFFCTLPSAVTFNGPSLIPPNVLRKRKGRNKELILNKKDGGN